MADEEWTQLEEYCLVEEVRAEQSDNAEEMHAESLDNVKEVGDKPPDAVEVSPEKPPDSVLDEPLDKSSGTDDVEATRQKDDGEDKTPDGATDENDKADTAEEKPDIVYSVIEGSSQRLRPKLVDSRGFAYTQYNQNKDGSITWRCTVRNPKMFCGTLVRQVGDEFYLGKKEHCHLGCPDQMTIDTIKSQVKLAATSHLFEPAAEIINSVLSCNVSDMTEMTLPKTHSLVRTANRIRQKLFPPNPGDKKFDLNLDAVPDYFLMKDVKSRNRRHLIFSTPNQQVLLARANKWYLDTTPKVVKEPFTQLVGVHCFLKKLDEVSQMPLVYILMTSKEQRDYKSVFGAIRGLLPEDICLEEVLTDFEPDLWKALKAVFPEVSIKGCYSHWQQAIWTKAKELGLSKVDAEGKEVFSMLQDLMGLPFLPPSLIPPMFETLRNDTELPALQTIFDYVASTWIDTDVRPPSTWSCYNQSLRASSDSENWHQQLKTKLNRSKVALYPLIQLLYSEAKCVDIRVRLASEKKVQRHQRKTHNSAQGRVYRYWREFEEGTRTAKALLRDCALAQRNAPLRAFKHGRRKAKSRAFPSASLLGHPSARPRTDDEDMRGEDLLLQACTTMILESESMEV